LARKIQDAPQSIKSFRSGHPLMEGPLSLSISEPAPVKAFYTLYQMQPRKRSENVEMASKTPSENCS